MPFTTEIRRYTRANIESLNLGQNGVYGIFRGNSPIYIGSGDIRDRMLAHINGDNPCITENTPDLWIAEVFRGDPKWKEGQLILEYNPICNKVIPRWDGK